MMGEQEIGQMGQVEQAKMIDTKSERIPTYILASISAIVMLVLVVFTVIAIRRPAISASTTTLMVPQVLPDKLAKINNFPEAWADFNTHVATLRKLQNDPVQKQIQSETDIARGILDRLLPVAQSAGYTWDGNNLQWTVTPPVIYKDNTTISK